MALPQMRKKNPLAIFWAWASYQNKKAPNFLEERNQGLASQYTQQGIQDKAWVQNQLMQNKAFARANPNDQQNTISNILWMMKKGWASTNMVQKATASNPISMVNVGTQPTDLNGLDLWWLQDEYTRYMYRSQSGNLNEDDAVRLWQIQRMISQKSMESNSQMSPQNDQSIQDLQAQRDAEATRLQWESSSQLDAYRRQVEANLNKQIMDLESSGRKTADAAAGAMSFSGFGRGTANVEQQTEIERQKQESINAARAAAEMEIMREQQRLAWADSETLWWYDQQIAQLRWNASQIQQQLAANAQKINQQQNETFTNTLNDAMAKQQAWIWLNINDEKAFSQAISYARNNDGTVNEDVLNSFPEQYRAIIRAWVANTSVAWPKRNLKRERIGGSNKNPAYWFVDLDSGEVISNAQANAMGYGGWGWGWGGGRSWGGGWAMGAMPWQAWVNQWSVYDQIMATNPWWFKNIDQSKNYWFATNAITANEDINNNKDYITWLSSAKMQWLKMIPWFAEWLKPQQYKIQEQAETNFVNAILRQESWAAIPDSEMAKYRQQYFPQPWDWPDVIAQKARNRNTKIESLVQSSWKANVLKPIAQQTYAWQSNKTTTQQSSTNTATTTKTTQAPANTNATTTATTKSWVSKNKFKKLLGK